MKSIRMPFLLPLLAASILMAAAAEARKAPVDKSVDYMIVVTGGELLIGAYPDGHTHFLTRTLRPLGLHCLGSMIVEDKRAELAEALRIAAGKSPLVLVTGGLGPTENDITRQAMADFSGIPLAEHPEVMREMERRFGQPREKLRANLRRQTEVPTRGAYLRNSNGTAVGLVFELDKTVLVALPGPPRELQPMVVNELVPYLSRRFGTRSPGCSLTLRFVGIGQSSIDQALKEPAILPGDVSTSSQFEGGRVDFTFSLPDDTPQERERLRELKQRILLHLGDYIYADDESTLEEHVVKLLAARGASLALAEVGSCGSLASGLNGADGANRVLKGAFVAPTEETMRSLLQVSEEKWTAASAAGRAGEMAGAAAARAASTWAVAVGEVEQDSSGARFVQLAIWMSGERCELARFGLRGTGELALATLTTQVLDHLRRKLR